MPLILFLKNKLCFILFPIFLSCVSLITYFISLFVCFGLFSSQSSFLKREFSNWNISSFLMFAVNVINFLLTTALPASDLICCTFILFYFFSSVHYFISSVASSFTLSLPKDYCWAHGLASKYVTNFLVISCCVLLWLQWSWATHCLISGISDLLKFVLWYHEYVPRSHEKTYCLLERVFNNSGLFCTGW